MTDKPIVALPIDGLDSAQFQIFRKEWSGAPLRLVITAHRARALGIDVKEPVALLLSEREEFGSILSMTVDPVLRRRVVGLPAGAGAAAGIDLAKLAALLPALLIVDREELPVSASFVEVEAAAVGAFRQFLGQSLRIAACANVPLEDGSAGRFVVFRDAIGGSPAALVVGRPDFTKPVLVRLHSACLTGDVFGSQRCDCGDQLRLALGRLVETGGIILYLQQEGRGLGLANKIRAYELQDRGLDTVDANVTLGFADDEREYQIAARMLQLLGCHGVVLLTNSPVKLQGLSRAGVEICGSMPLQAPIKAENRRYLMTKAVRAGHRLDHLWTTGLNPSPPRRVAAKGRKAAV
jgi:GTP cyclohydrolase II